MLKHEGEEGNISQELLAYPVFLMGWWKAHLIIVSTFSNPELLKLERCDLIEEVKNFNIHFLGERRIHTKCVL